MAHPYEHTSAVKLIQQGMHKSRLSRREIAMRIGVEPNFLSMVTKGTSPVPPQRAPALAECLGLDLDLVVRCCKESYPRNVAWKTAFTMPPRS